MHSGRTPHSNVRPELAFTVPGAVGGGCCMVVGDTDSTARQSGCEA